MKIRFFKKMTGLTIALASCAAFAAQPEGSGQIGSAGEGSNLVKGAYRNMNIPLIQCKVSAETRAAILASGNEIAEELSLLADFEAAMQMETVKDFKSKAFVVESSKKVGSHNKDAVGAGAIQTGTITVDLKTSVVVFTSDFIKYNHKYITKQIITFDQNKLRAEVKSFNAVDSSTSLVGKYDCKGFANE